VKALLGDLEAACPGSTACLVLRGGAMLSGRAPAAVNREVYAAMAATMLGASEVATADLGGAVASVSARLREGALVCAPVGTKLLLVLFAPGPDPSPPALQVSDTALKLAALF
jgi:predicted regulator of Ras-like GTPase activity (Roadblock/LC7/MglB family)